MIFYTYTCCFVLEFISKTTTQKSLSINVRLNRTLVSLNTVSTMDVLKQGIHGFYLQILEGKQRWYITSSPITWPLSVKNINLAFKIK